MQTYKYMKAQQPCLDNIASVVMSICLMARDAVRFVRVSMLEQHVKFGGVGTCTYCVDAGPP